MCADPRQALLGALLSLGCMDQYQRHAPTGDVPASDASITARAEAAAPPDAPPRTNEIDLELRDAFDGRGVELGPIIPRDAEAWRIDHPRGATPLEMINGQLVLAGSGSRPGHGWAVPLVRFTPQPDGRATDATLEWIPLGHPDFQPGETSARYNDTTFVVCARDQVDPETDRDTLCSVLGMTPPLAFGAWVAPGLAQQIRLMRNPGSNNHFITLITHHTPSPGFSLRHWEMDLSRETEPVIERELACPARSALLGGRYFDLWVATADPPECVPGRRTLRVELIFAPPGVAARTLVPPATIDFAAPPFSAVGDALPVIEAAALHGDREDGAGLFVNRRVETPSRTFHDAIFVRLRRDGSWSLRRVDAAAEARWVLPRPGGGWLVGLSREVGEGERASELLRIDVEGRRLGPSAEYARGRGVIDLGYGLDASERGLWVVFAERAPDAGADARHALRLRRIELRPDPR